jgi:hypothetical protein
MEKTWKTSLMTGVLALAAITLALADSKHPAIAKINGFVT